MRDPGLPYINMIQAQQQSLIAYLYTFTLRDGTNYYFTDLDLDITYQSNLYVSGSIRISGLKMKLAVGLQVDEQEIKISALPGDTIGSVAFLAGCRNGLLDGAYLTRDRAVWAATGAPPWLVYQGAPITVFRMFYGLVSGITKIGRTFAEMKIKSPLVLLNIDMPRNTYQLSCNYTLFDSGCSLVKASFGTAGIVDSGADFVKIPWQGGVLPSVSGGDSLPYYAQGRVLFNTGVLANQQFFVSTNDANALYLVGNLDIPSVGDSFTAYAGCMKTVDACNLKFNNLVNYRGFPYVPPVVIGL